MTLPKELTTVTPLSKTLALLLFITLPIIAFFLGIKYQESKISQTETLIVPTISSPLVPSPTQTSKTITPSGSPLTENNNNASNIENIPSLLYPGLPWQKNNSNQLVGSYDMRVVASSGSKLVLLKNGEEWNTNKDNITSEETTNLEVNMKKYYDNLFDKLGWKTQITVNDLFLDASESMGPNGYNWRYVGVNNGKFRVFEAHSSSKAEAPNTFSCPCKENLSIFFTNIMSLGDIPTMPSL